MRWRPPSTVGISVCPPRLRGVQGGTDLRDHQSFFFLRACLGRFFFRGNWTPFLVSAPSIQDFSAPADPFFSRRGNFSVELRQPAVFLRRQTCSVSAACSCAVKNSTTCTISPPPAQGAFFFFVSPSRGLSRSLSLERERAGGGGSGGREGKSCTVASSTIFMGVPSTIFMVVPSTACSPPHCLFRFAIRSCQAGEPGGWTGSAHSRALSTARGVEGVEGGSGGREWREGVERGRDTCTPGEGHVTCTRRVHTICRRD